MADSDRKSVNPIPEYYSSKLQDIPKRQSGMSLITHRIKQYLIIGGLLLAGAPLIGGALEMIGLPRPFAIALTTLIVITLTVVWVRRAGEDDDGAVWNAIPQSQYAGRFVEAGGLTRSEQEDALRKSHDKE